MKASRPSWLLAFLGYKLVILALGLFALVAVRSGLQLSPTALGLKFFQIDVINIVRVARGGYLAQAPSSQVFPAFPMVIRVFQWIFRDWNLSAFLAAQFCSFLAFYYFYRLARLRLDGAGAWLALILFASAPSAYVLSLPYTEALYCAATFATAYYLKRDRAFAAGVASFISVTTRMPGVLWMPIAGLGLIKVRRSDSQRKFTLLCVFTGTALGFLAYLLLNKMVYGDWFYFILEQRKYYGGHLGLPFSGLWTLLQGLPKGITDLFFMVLAGMGLYWVIKSEDEWDIAFLALNFSLLLCLSPWIARQRYILPLYPLYIAAVPRLRDAPMRLYLLLLASIGLCVLFFVTYLLGPLST